MAKKIVNIRLRPDQEERINAIVERSAILDTSKFVRIAGATVGDLRGSHDFSDWDLSMTSRCFVHLCNSLGWRRATGSNPPHPPFTANEYARARVPWFAVKHRSKCSNPIS